MPVRVRTMTPASGRNRLSMAGHSPAKVLWAVKELFVAHHQHLTSVPRRRSGLAPVPWETQREESGWVTNAQLNDVKYKHVRTQCPLRRRAGIRNVRAVGGVVTPDRTTNNYLGSVQAGVVVDRAARTPPTRQRVSTLKRSSTERPNSQTALPPLVYPQHPKVHEAEGRATRTRIQGLAGCPAPPGAGRSMHSR
jgi:hypothetical protein